MPQPLGHTASKSNIKSRGPGVEQTKACCNCNRLVHFARDSCCPAKIKDGGNCGARGNIAVCCGNKKLSSSSQKGIVPENKKKAYPVTEGVSREGDGYAFTVGGGLRVGDIILKVGGIVPDTNVSDITTRGSPKTGR